MGEVTSIQYAMDQHNESVYLQEIRKQGRYATQGMMMAEFCLGKSLDPEERAIPGRSEFWQAEVFRNIHSMLTHASNVSKLLWPPVRPQKTSETDEKYRERLLKDAKAQRAKHLRDVLHIAENDHPLRSRELRDHLEHYDERLDKWASDSTHFNIVDDCIGPLTIFSGVDATDIMRTFDPRKMEFSFRGQTYDLRPMVQSLGQIVKTLGRMLESTRSAH